jgi:hypothetical protein
MREPGNLAMARARTLGWRLIAELQSDEPEELDEISDLQLTMHPAVESSTIGPGPRHHRQID